MEKAKKNLSKSNVLLCGLAFTSRTETVEDYLKDKANSLTVVALSSCFLKENLSSCRVYERRVLKNEFKIPNFRLKDYKWHRQPLVLLVFLVYWASICSSLIKLKRKYDIYIGVSHSFALLGAILKKADIVKNLIYYCIDYYIPGNRLEFNTLFVKLINLIDRFTVKNADYIWDLSPKISDYRLKIGRIKTHSYKSAVVPLGYSRRLRRSKALDEINRWDIGFVGCISPNQGLQLLVEAMPLVLQEFPLIKVTIIGQGPFLSELKNMVFQEKLNRYFNFLGFIKNEDKMLDILSGCAIGVALYHSSSDRDNITCADTGKPKLYALCGLPIITTEVYILHEEITHNKAGKVIDYSVADLKNAICYMMENDERLEELRKNSYCFGEQFISETIFDEAIKKLNLD